MKYFILIFIISVTYCYSQTDTYQSFYELKQNIKSEILIQEDDTQIYFKSDNNSAKKKTGLAILYSLLLPGMGELYAESYNSGIYFTIAEGVLWGVYIGMNTYGNWQKDRYERYAILKAGISPEGKDKDYYSRIGIYSNIEQYNDQKALERNYKDMYDPTAYFWKWNSTEDRKIYRDMWLSSEQTFNDMRFVVGAMIVNRLASAINAVRLVSRYNSRLEEQSWNVSFGLSNQPNLPTSLSLNFQTAL